MDNLCHISQRIKQKSQDIVVQLLSSVIDSLWPMNCSTPGFPVLHCLPHLLKLMSIESAMPSNHLILCRPLLLLPSIFPNVRVFSNKLALCIRWPKYWSFSFIISPPNEYAGLISFRVDWFNLLAVQGTQESSPAPRFKSINSLALSPLYGPTLTSVHDSWKNHSFDYRDFCRQSDVSAFEYASRLVIAFIPRRNCLLT